MEKKLFSLPKISSCRTFVYFQYWNRKTWKYERFKKHLSKKVPKRAIETELAQMVEFWTTELKNGYNPYAEKKAKEEILSFNYIINSIEEICKARVEFLRKKSNETYISKVTIFTNSEFLTSEEITMSPL